MLYLGLKSVSQKCLKKVSAQFTVCISPIIPCLPPPPLQILHDHFSWVLQSSQEELKTMLTWKMLGGKQGVLCESGKILENASVCFKRIALLL